MNRITTIELELLESCQTAEDWGNACDTIKANHGGFYPDDWWPTVKETGLMDKIMSRWGADSELKIEKV